MEGLFWLTDFGTTGRQNCAR